jgi:hypothetical protein
MMNQFKEALQVLNTKRQQRDSILQRIELFEKQKVVIWFELEQYVKLVQEEERDVIFLESLTLSSIINSILLNKVETLEREKKILYANQIKEVKLKEELKHINEALNQLNNELETYASIDAEYRLLTEEMTMNILVNNLAKAKILDSLFKQRSEYERERIHLHESLNEGEEMLKRLDATKIYLIKAQNIGNYSSSDIGIMTEVKMYHNLDEAQELLHDIQWGLRKFHNALHSLGWHQENEIEQFLKASDYWIDGIFEDYPLKSAITKLIDNMNTLIVDILQIDQQLRKGIENSLSMKEAVEKSIETFFDELIE